MRVTIWPVNWNDCMAWSFESQRSKVLASTASVVKCPCGRTFAKLHFSPRRDFNSHATRKICRPNRRLGHNLLD